MFYVYAFYNRSLDKIYIGQTGNLSKRLEEHNLKKGNHFTARFNGDWSLVYQESVNSRKEALHREKQLKSYRGREFIKKYIPR